MPRKKKQNESLSIKLAPGEFELLELFWTRGEMTIAETHRELIGRGRKVAYPTVQARLNRLVEKQLVSRTGQYPAVYRALVRREEVSGGFYDQVESFCGGNIAPLMLHLAEKRDFKPSEIEALKKIIRRYEEGETES